MNGLQDPKPPQISHETVMRLTLDLDPQDIALLVGAWKDAGERGTFAWFVLDLARHGVVLKRAFGQ